NEVQLTVDREVMVKGPSVFSGYWKGAGEPARFEGAYYRTGDEGLWEKGGFLKLVGRSSEFIKTSTGRRIAPHSIEQHFKELVFVDQAIILGNARKGPVLLVTIDSNYFPESASEISPTLSLSTKEITVKGLKDRVALLPGLSQPLGILVLNRSFSVL